MIYVSTANCVSPGTGKIKTGLPAAGIDLFTSFH